MRLLATALFLAATPVLANDSVAELGTGGLVFITSDTLRMESEDLHISASEVRVTYSFRNLSDQPQDVLVAFPLPDITGSVDFMVAVPDIESDNAFGFATSFNGEPVAAELHQQAFAFNLDQTDALASMGIPLTPFGERTHEALQALSEEQIERLLYLGLVAPMEFDDGSGWQVRYEPVWTLRSTYSWQAHFEPGETATVEHSYRPSVGGTVAVTFLEDDGSADSQAADYRRRYCTDDSFVSAVRKTLASPDEPWSAPFTESWISYIWSTGNNWSGPIGKFTLTIDKGDPRNLVSFCWDGEVTKIGPTTFRMEAEDWYPPWNRELEVLILNRRERED